MPSPSTSVTLSLSPAQSKAREGLASAFSLSSLIVLRGKTGRGRTTVLKSLHADRGGAFVSMKEFLQHSTQRHPIAIEDALYEWILQPLHDHDVVFVDDFHLAMAALTGCHFYPRSGFVGAPLMALASFAAEAGKHIVLGTDSSLPDSIHDRAISWPIEGFGVADYRHLCGEFAGEERLGDLDFEKVFRFAPKLNAHQLKGACHWLAFQAEPTTQAFIEYLRSLRLTSNVELGEVAKVALSDLKGVDDIVRSLETNVVLPLEKEDLVAELGLEGKRGVLLAGPPGTGKTTVGRALAHRLKGKFFLIDGTFISGTNDFYNKVHQVFHAAMDNAPAVIFIDDSDVIFESGDDPGLYRYLLTMLDGLESKSAGRVCVMMTAMNVGNLPPALVRSGRIELWLEMRLPDARARSEILAQLLQRIPESLRGVDEQRLVDATEGFTGADLRRTVDDAKSLYAYDRAYGTGVGPLTGYFLAAVDGVKSNKQKYAEAEAQARQLRPARPPWYYHADGPSIDEEE